MIHNPFAPIRDRNGRIHWLWVVIYVLLIVLVIWAALLILIRTGVVGRGTWLYDHTVRIPGLSTDSWARRPYETATTT